MKDTTLIILGVALFFIGFFIGRSTIDSDTEVKYGKREPMIASIDTSKFELLKEEKPDIQYRDTGSVKYKYIPPDTAAIIADYELKRSYKVTAFDNKELGKLELFPVIQYNKLAGLDYTFTPMQKEITKTKYKVLEPFISADYSTLDIAGIGGGCFYHNLGIEYQFQKDFRYNDTGHSFGLKYKF